MATASHVRSVPLSELHERLRQAWSQPTSSDPDNWSEENPAWGQCAVTALIIQDILGGDLLRSTVQGCSHYWNRLPDGAHVDLTWEQFESTAIKSDVIERDREYVLSFPETVERYARLREQLDH